MLNFEDIIGGLLSGILMVFNMLAPYIIPAVIASSLGYLLFRVVLKWRGEVGGTLFFLLYLFFLSPNKHVFEAIFK